MSTSLSKCSVWKVKPCIVTPSIPQCPLKSVQPMVTKLTVLEGQKVIERYKRRENGATWPTNEHKWQSPIFIYYYLLIWEARPSKMYVTQSVQGYTVLSLFLIHSKGVMSNSWPRVRAGDRLLLLLLTSSQAAAVYPLLSKAVPTAISTRTVRGLLLCVISATGTCATWESW